MTLQTTVLVIMPVRIVHLAVQIQYKMFQFSKLLHKRFIRIHSWSSPSEYLQGLVH